MAKERRIRHTVAPKGVTVEDAAILHADRIRRKMPEKKKKVFVEAKNYWYYRIPSLGWQFFREGERIPSWIPKYFPVTGVPVITRTSKGVLKPQVLSKGIESAIRQQKRIGKMYLNEERKKVDELSEGILLLGTSLTGGKVTEERLEEVNKRAQELFSSLGIRRPVNPILQDAFEKVKLAGGRDSRGRINPLVSRIRFRSAYWNSIRREVITKMVAEKAFHVYSFLLVEREFTRSTLTNALDSLLNAGIDYQILSGELNEENKKEICRQLRSLVYNFLRPVKVYPYLGVARLAEYLILPRRERIKNIENTISYYYGFENGAPKPIFLRALSKEKPLIQLVKEGDPEGNVLRRLGGIRKKIDDLLKDPNFQDITPNSKKDAAS